MQNVSKALNILTAMKISNSQELLNEIDSTRNSQLVLKSELNSENQKYMDLKDIQSAEEEFDFYRVYFDKMNIKRTKRGRKNIRMNIQPNLTDINLQLKNSENLYRKANFLLRQK